MRAGLALALLGGLAAAALAYPRFVASPDECRLALGTLRLLGGDPPLAYGHYKGPWEFYTLAPFLAAFREPARALALHSAAWLVLLAGTCFALLWTLTRRAGVAALGALACVSSPRLAAAAASGAVEGGLGAPALSAAALALLALALESGRRSRFLLSALLMGFCAGASPQGLGALAGWAAAALLLRRELAERLRFDRALALESAGALLVGLLPFCADPGRLLARLVVTEAGVRNADYVSNLALRLEQGLLALAGAYEHARVSWRHAPALAGLLLPWLAARPSRARPAELIPAAFLLAALLLSPFTAFSLRAAHLLVLLPAALALGAAALSRPGLPRWAAPAALALVLLGNGAGLDAWRRDEGERARVVRELETLAPAREIVARARGRVFSLTWRLVPALRLADAPGLVELPFERGTPANERALRELRPRAGDLLVIGEQGREELPARLSSLAGELGLAARRVEGALAGTPYALYELSAPAPARPRAPRPGSRRAPARP